MYLKSATRNFLKQLNYNIINIVGVAIGLGMCTLCFLFVENELGFDNHFKNADNIYRVIRQDIIENGDDIYTQGTSSNLASAIRDEVPEVKKVSRLHYNYNVNVKQPGKTDIFQERVAVVDKEIAEIFSLNFAAGSYETSFEKPYGIIITKEIANKIFGDENPMGKTLHLQGFYFIDKIFEVTGVIEDLPKNSTVDFGLITAESSFLGSWLWSSWAKHSGYLPVQTYMQVKKGSDINLLTEKLNVLIPKHLPEEVHSKIKYSLQPLNRIHLYSQRDYTFSSGGDVVYLYIFITLSILILVIVIINFINISNAQFYHRNLEVGVKKTFGSTSRKLISQSLVETFLLLIICLPLILLFVNFLIPLFNEAAYTDLDLGMLTQSNVFIRYVLLLVGLFFAIGIFPSIKFSSAKPTGLLSKPIKTKNQTIGQNIRIIVQFAIVMVLIISTYHMNKQLRFLVNKDLGFKTENIIIVPILADDERLRNRFEEVKDEFLQYPDIIEASASHAIIGRYAERLNVIPEGKKQMDMYAVGADPDYIPFYGLKIIKGRNLVKYSKADEDAVILNQKAVDILGWDDPIGKKIHFWDRDRIVIGVVENYHQRGLSEDISPVFLQNSFPKNWLALKYRGDDVEGVTNFIKEKYAEIAPSVMSRYYFFEDILKEQYTGEKVTMQIFGVFSILTLVITCIGLFGLTVQIAKRRTKEIGIRKVNGAKVQQIITLLNRDFLIWIFIAFVIAWPISWISISKWLENFTYKMSINWFVFVGAGLLTFIIAILTVSWQTWRAASQNPVEALRYE